jgi:imidazoleglycerol-phosphate dehydratase
MRRTKIRRKTNETDITVELELDGSGKYSIDTGINFLNHMLELFAKHGFFDLKIACRGDLHVDDHHTVEDVAITLGMAFDDALGDRTRINRYGFAYVPMDEALARCAIDLSGRPFLIFKAKFKRSKIGDIATEMIEHFFKSLADSIKANIHIEILYGRNTHHMIEAMFKSLAMALSEAVRLNLKVKGVRSTKGKI